MIAQQVIESIGLSKLQLQNLQQQKNNVIPMFRVIDIDFNKQRPEWYQEPTSFYDNNENLLLFKFASWFSTPLIKLYWCA